MTFPNSEAQVVSTVAMALDQFLIAVREEVPDIKLVYDEKLSFETALAALRSNNNQASSDSNCYPLFAFKRTVLRYSKDGIGKRGITDRARGVRSGGQVPIYRCIHGEFDVQFLYITKTMEQLERFEIAWMGEESFSEDRELKVDLQSIIGVPDWTYYITPSALEDKTVEDAGVYYKAVSGSLTIRGVYLVFREQLKHINSVSMRILDFNGTVFAAQNIT